jgi:hypothetical protein
MTSFIYKIVLLSLSAHCKPTGDSQTSELSIESSDSVDSLADSLHPVAHQLVYPYGGYNRWPQHQPPHHDDYYNSNDFWRRQYEL